MRRRLGALALRMMVGVALIAALLFALAAVLVHVGSIYGPVVACATGAMAFLVVAAALTIAAGIDARRRERKARESAAALKASLASLLATPSALLFGTALAKKAFTTVPFALIGGIVVGYAVSRSRGRADS